MTLAEFHERVCEPPLAQVRKKGALPLCCCALTKYFGHVLAWSDSPISDRCNNLNIINSMIKDREFAQDAEGEATNNIPLSDALSLWLPTRPYLEFGSGKKLTLLRRLSEPLGSLALRNGC